MAASVAAFVLLSAAPAGAYTFTRALKEGASGPDVKVLQIRVAGWFDRADQSQLSLDGDFGAATTAAIKAFQAHYGLQPDGIAGPATFAVIDGLEDPDGSTIHFDWSEFKQKRNSNCSAKANAYSGTFKGGMVAPARVRKNVKRLMWRLEALRAKGGDHAIGINSAYRSVSYNDCIGGARSSQHMYGTAADNRMANTDNHTHRNLARRSQFSGIGCYSALSHNHLDLRVENRDLGGARFWWWPERDDAGRDLADDGKPCWGESAKGSSTQTLSTSDGSSAPVLPGERFLSIFEDAPEWYQGRGD